MAPPPVTPSPHRFITKPKPRTESQAPSSLRVQQRPSEASSQQFAPTPRFSIPSARKARDAATQAPPSPLLSRVRPPIRPRRVREDIEDNSEDEDETPEDPGALTCKEDRYGDPSEDDEMLLDTYVTRPSKRLRASPSQPPTSHPPHHKDAISICSSSPPAPASPPSPLRLTGARFLLSTSHAPTTPAPPRPSFIFPPEQDITTRRAPPLLSPHRRGSKFLPTGLASTVRDWVVEASQGGMVARHTLGDRDEVQWAEKIQTGAVAGGFGSMVWLVKETGPEGKDGRGWVLMRNGAAREEIRLGSVVGVRRPCWEVELGGVVWRIGVEWRVLAARDAR